MRKVASIFSRSTAWGGGGFEGVSARGFPQLKVGEAHQLHHEDLSACNTKSAPDKVSPTALGGIAVEGERIRMTLAPASWNTICLVPIVPRN